MKFSRYRGQDIRSMLLRLFAVAVAILAVAAVVIGLGYKYVSPKVNAYIAEARKNKEETEKQSQEDSDSLEDGEDTADSQEEINTEDGEGEPEDVGEEDVSGESQNGEDEPEDAADENESPADSGDDLTDPAEDPAVHRYEYIVEDCSWTEAMERCQARGGYLANINSQEENDYITSEIIGKGLEKAIFYLGASRGSGTDYYWINTAGEYYGDVLNNDGRWMENEPSYRDGDIEENVLSIFYYDDEGRWVWNDSPENILDEFSYYSGRIGYVCEYNE